MLAAVCLRSLFRGGPENEELAGALLLARGLSNLSKAMKPPG